MLVDPVLGLRSLGTLARALSLSMPLDPLFETAAEEALVALHAASVSSGRLESSGRSLRTLINVGDLAPNEARWPHEEVYCLVQWEDRVLSDGITRIDRLGDSDCHPNEGKLLEDLGKGSSVSAAIRVDGDIWGEFYATRHLGQRPFAPTGSSRTWPMPRSSWMPGWRSTTLIARTRASG